MSKTQFIKEQLAEKGIFNYTEEDIQMIKAELMEAILVGGRDRYQAFEDAFYIWQRRKGNERD